MIDVTQKMSHSINKLTVTLIAGIYIAIALFGMSVFIMASEHGDMMGGGCPLMRDTGSLCQTGILDHISHWNILFAATLAGAVFFAAAPALLYAPFRALAVSPPSERYKRYVKDHPHVRLFQTIVQEFSDGVIQPKIFS